MVGDAPIDGDKFEHVCQLAIYFFSAKKLRLVIAGKVGPRQVAVRNGACETLRQWKAHGLRYRRKKYPEVVALHQHDLTTLGRRLRGHDDGVFVSLRQYAKLSRV